MIELFLLDVGVGARDVGLGLVVVVVRDEVFHRVVGEEALELAVELRRQRLVGREDQRRPVGRRDHLRHREGLARAGDAEQHLVALVLPDAGHELGDGGRLVALGLELGGEVEPDAALRLVGAVRAMRRPRFADLDVGVAGDEQRLQAFRRGARAGHAERVGGFGLVLRLSLGLALVVGRAERGPRRRHRRGFDVVADDVVHRLAFARESEHVGELLVDARDRRAVVARILVEPGLPLLEARLPHVERRVEGAPRDARSAA